MKRWPRWEKLIGSLLAFALFSGGIIWWAQVRARHAWESHQAEMAALGESLDWRDFVPPKIPDDQNLAMAPIMQGKKALYALLPENGLAGWRSPDEHGGFRTSQVFPFDRA